MLSRRVGYLLSLLCWWDPYQLIYVHDNKPCFCISVSRSPWWSFGVPMDRAQHPLYFCCCDKKQHNQKQLGFIEGGVYLYLWMAPEVRDHHWKISNTQPEYEAERSHFHPQADHRKSKQEVGRGYELLKHAPSDVFPLARLYRSVTSPNVTTNWRANVQIREPVGDSSLSNH